MNKNRLVFVKVIKDDYESTRNLPAEAALGILWFTK